MFNCTSCFCLTGEALHLAHLMAAHGYFFPIDDHMLTVKNDNTFYRFQVSLRLMFGFFLRCPNETVMFPSNICNCYVYSVNVMWGQKILICKVAARSHVLACSCFQMLKFWWLRQWTYSSTYDIWGVSSCEYGQVLSHTISTLKILHWHNIFTVLSVANSSLLFHISFLFPSLVHSQLKVAY